MKTSFYPNINYNPAAIAAGVGGLLKAGVGLLQRGQANKWLKKNDQPIEGMPDEVIQNQNTANQMATRGLPAEQYNKAMRDIQRQQLTALRYGNSRRGMFDVLPAIQQGTNDATLDLNAKDATMRNANQQYAIGVNSNVANWKSKLFDMNVRQKWQRQWEQMMGQLGSGNQNLVGGLDSLASAGVQFGMGAKGGSKSGGVGYAPDFDNYGQPQ